MFGISSREALTTRQSRWTRDIANNVNTVNSAKNQVAKNVTTMATTPTPRKSIVSYMNDASSSSDEDEANVLEQFVKLNSRLDDIVNRLLKVEQYHIELQLAIKTLLNQANHAAQANQGLESSFVPYFNDEAFVGIDNSCTLVGNHLQFNIEIFGQLKDCLTLYPFGSSVLSRDLPKFLEVELTVENISHKYNVPGEKLSTGVYVLKFTEMFATPDKISYNGSI